MDKHFNKVTILHHDTCMRKDTFNDHMILLHLYITKYFFPLGICVQIATHTLIEHDYIMILHRGNA